MITNFNISIFEYLRNVCVAPKNQGLEELRRIIGSYPNLPNLYDIRDIQGNSLAHMAIQSGNDEVLKLLITTDPAFLRSQNVNSVGANILHFACFYAGQNAANLILDKAPNLLYFQDYNQNSPAHLAVLSQMNDFLQKALLKQEAESVNDFREIEDAKSLNPFKLAIYHDRLDANEAMGIRSLPIYSDSGFNNLDSLFLYACRIAKLEAAKKIFEIVGIDEFKEMILFVESPTGKTIFHEIFNPENDDYQNHERFRLAKFLLGKIPPDQAEEILLTKDNDDYQVIDPLQNKVFAEDLLSLLKSSQEVVFSSAASVERTDVVKIASEEIAPPEIENQSISEEQERAQKKKDKKERQAEQKKMSAEDDYSQFYEKSLKQKIKKDFQQQKARQEREGGEMSAEELLSKSYEKFLKQQKEQQMNQESEKYSTTASFSKKRTKKKKKEEPAKNDEAPQFETKAQVKSEISWPRLNQITKRIFEIAGNYSVMIGGAYGNFTNFNDVNYIVDRSKNITLINRVIDLKYHCTNSKFGSEASRIDDSRELDQIFDELSRDPRLDIESKVISGTSPFLYACRGRCFDLALKLIDAGADVKVRSDNFFNALHYCAASPGAQSLEVAKIVISAADLDFIDMKTCDYLDSPASICCQVGNADMLEVILAKGLSPQTPFIWKGEKDLCLVRGLLNKALTYRQYDAAKVLISGGADLFSNSSSDIYLKEGAKNSFISAGSVKGKFKSPAEMIEELDTRIIKDLAKVISANFNRRDLGKLGPKLKKEVAEGLSKASKNPAATEYKEVSEEERNKAIEQLLKDEKSKPSASAKNGKAEPLAGVKKAGIRKG